MLNGLLHVLQEFSEPVASKKRKLCNYSGPEPTVEEIEAEFWRIVESPDEVHCNCCTSVLLRYCIIDALQFTSVSPFLTISCPLCPVSASTSCPQYTRCTWYSVQQGTVLGASVCVSRSLIMCWTQVVESLYGQDLDSGHHGSGFPLPPFRQRLLEAHLAATEGRTEGDGRKFTPEEAAYSEHKWNINNMPRCKVSNVTYFCICHMFTTWTHMKQQVEPLLSHAAKLLIHNCVISYGILIILPSAYVRMKLIFGRVSRRG